MNINEILSNCVAIIVVLSKKANLQEFELFAYEQACRATEVILKDFRRTWDDDEVESYQG